MSQMVGLFADVSNLYYCINKKFDGRKLDYKKYWDKAQQNDDKIYRAFAYGTQLNDEATAFIACLKHLGFITKYKKPKQYLTDDKKEIRKADWGVGLAMDVVRSIEKLDIIIIGSSDSDLVPLIEWIKEKGIKCLVMACGIPRELKDTADYFIEIEEDVLEDIKKITIT